MGLGPCRALVVEQVGIHLPVGRVVEGLGEADERASGP